MDSVSNDVSSSDKLVESSVVVIDDDITIKPSTTQNSCASDKNENEVDVQTTFLGDPNQQTSPLQDLLSWLHDESPFSENQLKDICISMSDFEKALKSVQPSAKREGFATVPDVTWNDIGSLRDIREELQMAIVVSICFTNMYF